jgi:hypothetical protein
MCVAISAIQSLDLSVAIITYAKRPSNLKLRQRDRQRHRKVSDSRLPTSRNRDPDSNVTEESELHQEKQHLSQTSTDAGTMISTKPVTENAFSSICDNFDPDSNITEEGDQPSEKHLSPQTSTDTGTTISTKPVLLNAFSSIRDNLDLTVMHLIAGRYLIAGTPQI